MFCRVSMKENDIQKVALVVIKTVYLTRRKLHYSLYRHVIVYPVLLINITAIHRSNIQVRKLTPAWHPVPPVICTFHDTTVRWKLSYSGVGHYVPKIICFLSNSFQYLRRLTRATRRTMKIVTCVAPVNIAVIKYWGKRDEDLILPLNDSLSTTLSTQHLCAKTSIVASPNFTEDKIWLNTKEESIDNPRIQRCLSKIRQLALVQEGGPSVPISWKVHISSENNFPTAAGLASSSAGYACLVFTLAELYGVTGDISQVARLGSGSACRSVLGGFVQWHKGFKDDGSDSIASQVADASHWPELRILILVVNDQQKHTSSTSGMQRSVATSELLKYRVDLVPGRIAAIEKAIKEKNFSKFAELVMKDSNQFHAVCLDTFPPAVYMNDTSHAIAYMVHKYNELQNGMKVAYTFDAGPNACLYTLQSEVPQLVGLVDYMFPAKGPSNIIKGIETARQPVGKDLRDAGIKPEKTGLLQYLILTEVGNGPHKLEGDSIHLINSSGEPMVK